MIVKDEEDNLPRCLDSVRGVVDEIIIVDTGSTDRTVEVARRYGARVYPFEWCDDFAKARNEALRHATGEWILVLDADEALDPRDRRGLRRLLRDREASAFLVNIQSPVEDRPSGRAVINPFPRLFRNGLGLQFEGRVHEQLSPSIARVGGLVKPTLLRIHHRGYRGTTADLTAKRERNRRLLEKQIAEHPDDALSHFHLGEVHALEGRWEEAMACYKKALGLPGLPPANRAVVYQNLANVYLLKGHPALALEACQRAFEEDRHIAIPHFLAAEALAQMGRYQEALGAMEAYLKQAGQKTCRPLDVDPNPAYILTFVGNCYLALDQPSQAEEAYREALTDDRTFPQALLGLGKAAFAQGKWQDASASLRAFLQVSPDHGEGMELLAQCALKLGAYDEARTLYQKLAEKVPSAMAHFALACLADSKGEVQEAIERCRKALTWDPADPRIHFLLGTRLMGQGRWDEAEKHLLTALALSPTTPEILHNLGLLYLRTANYPLAADCLQALLSLKTKGKEGPAHGISGWESDQHQHCGVERPERPDRRQPPVEHPPAPALDRPTDQRGGR